MKYATIRISAESYEGLLKIRAELMIEHRKLYSFKDVMAHILKHYGDCSACDYCTE